VEKTGQAVIYNRAGLYGSGNTSNCPVMPHIKIQVTKEGGSVSTLDMSDDILVTGSSDGSVQLFNLETGKAITTLSQSSSMVFKVRIIDNKIMMTSGSKVIIHELNRSDMSTKLTHMLADHTRDVLCLDAEDDIVVSGGLDTNVLVYKLGPENAHQLVHTLTGHKLKVRCVSMHGDHVVSGSWDRTAMLWNIVNGQCIRVLKHEMQVRCVAIDGHRILTGDIEGFVYAWDMKNCLDPTCGPEKLCLRAHNAMDPDIYCKDTEKIVYEVYLETAVQIQVAGGTGRIVVGDFWDYDAPDSFQLESFVHSQDVEKYNT